MAAADSSDIRICLLGKFEISRGKKILRADHWNRQKAAALLKRLAWDISRLSCSKAKNTAKSSLKSYKKLLAVVQAWLQQVVEIQPRLRRRKDAAADGLHEELDHDLPLVECSISNSTSET